MEQKSESASASKVENTSMSNIEISSNKSDKK